MCTMFAGYYSVIGQLPMVTVVHLDILLTCSGPCSRWIAIALTQERGKTMGIVSVYLAEILLKLTLGPISTHSRE